MGEIKINKIDGNVIPKSRPEVIYALAQYAHPSWYHSLLLWSTENLKKLLSYYLLPDYTIKDIDGIRRKVEMEYVEKLFLDFEREIELSLGTNRVVLWPFGYKVR